MDRQTHRQTDRKADIFEIKLKDAFVLQNTANMPDQFTTKDLEKG